MCTKKYNTKSELEKHIKQVHSLPDGAINTGPGPGGGINTGVPGPGGGINTGVVGAGTGPGPITQFTQEYKCSKT